MKGKLILTCVLTLACSLMVWAQGTGTINGKVEDVSGGALSGATVTVSDLATGAIVRAKTGTNGEYTVNGLSAGQQLVTVTKQGFEPYTTEVSLTTQQSTVVNAKLTVQTLSQSIVVRGTVLPGARPVPTRTDVLTSEQTIRILDRKQLDAAGPLAGGAQMISYTPGANVIGYGNTGSTKYSIQLNGISQGWAGESPSFISPGSLGITYDGIPVSDVATALWQSATMPQNLLIQNLAVTYGPGNPENRFYDNIGGGVEFTPIQPTVSTHMTVQGTYGSYNEKNIAFVMNTGSFHGWSTVIGGGVGNGDSYRTSADGFKNPTKNGAGYAKTIRMFSSGSFELGGYYAKAGGFRNQPIPLNNAGIYYNYDKATNTCSADTGSTSGVNLSQQTSGFFSTPPYSCYNKYDTNALWMIYARENLRLNATTTLTNTTWYWVIHRLHERYNDAFSTGPQEQEYNDPHSDSFGDKIGLSKVLPLNTVDVGAYYIHELYNTQNIHGNGIPGDFIINGGTLPGEPGNIRQHIVNIGANIRSGYFNQDDVALYAQDQFRPIPQIHITPGIRLVGFLTSYSNQALRVYHLTPGVVLSTHCSLYPIPPKGSTPAQGQLIDPFYNIHGVPNTKDAGSICSSHESRTGVEPSINAAVLPLPWLTIYGGYSTQFHSPTELGGGGGLFQKLNPANYILAEGKYSQVGVKMHFVSAPALKNFIFGLSYYHLDYVNQEIDYTLANGEEFSSGGNSTFHGVNIFFDDDPMSNLHFFLNFNGEAARFTKYNSGQPPSAPCIAPSAGGSCYSNLPVSYTPNVTANFGIYYGIRHGDHVMIEPRFTYTYTGSQHIWTNNADNPTNIPFAGGGGPSSQTMPGFGTANLSFIAPVTKNINLGLHIQNLFNNKYNNYEYVSSGGYFTPNTGNSTGAILGYPGAPISTYGTISFQF